MYRLILIILAIHAQAAIGNDYVLRVEMTEQAVVPASEPASQEDIDCSAEVVARSGFPFHGRVKIGAETVSLTGKFRPAYNGAFDADFECEHALDTGRTATADDGTRKPVVEKSVVGSSVRIGVGRRNQA